jgi:hypothetical protein
MFVSRFPVDPDHTADRRFAVSQAEARERAAHRLRNRKRRSRGPRDSVRTKQCTNRVHPFART